MKTVKASSTPDSFQPISAFRVWEVVGHSPNLRLKSWARDTIWEAGTLEAECELACHTAPDFHCKCGIYAMRRRGRLRYSVYGDDILGRVELYGKVVVATEGYRAQVARIVELWPSPWQEPVAVELAERYGATVSTKLLSRYRSFVGGPLHGTVLTLREARDLGIPDDDILYRYWDYVGMSASSEDFEDDIGHDIRAYRRQLSTGRLPVPSRHRAPQELPNTTRGQPRRVEGTSDQRPGAERGSVRGSLAAGRL